MNRKGQASIEFALTMILVIAFILFYFQLTLALSFGNFVHYATFMAARAYLASSSSQDDQTSRARYVIVATLKKSQGESGTDRFPSIAKAVGQGDPVGTQIGPGSNFIDGDPYFSWMQGVRYAFKSKIFLISLSGRSTSAADSLNFLSESWLGREPSYSDCQGDMGKLGFFDNGC